MLTKKLFAVATLTGISNKGKQRVKQHGERWRQVGFAETVGFPTHAPGPFVFLRAIDPHSEDIRWVSLKNDPNFEVVFDDEENI